MKPERTRVYGTLSYQGKDRWFRILEKHPVTGSREYERAYVRLKSHNPSEERAIKILMADKGWEFCYKRPEWENLPDYYTDRDIPNKLAFAKKKVP